MVNKLTIVNTFVLNTLHRKITQAAITSHKTTEKIENLKCGGGSGKELFNVVGTECATCTATINHCSVTNVLYQTAKTRNEAAIMVLFRFIFR